MIIRCSRRTLLAGSLTAAAGAVLPAYPLYGSAATLEVAADPSDPNFWWKAFVEVTLAGLSLIPGAGNLLALFGALLLPDEISEGKDSRWQRYIEAVNKIVDEKIDQAHYALVKTHLEGITDQLRIYKGAIESGDNTHIRSVEDAMNSVISSMIPSFMATDRKARLLPLFVPAANIHLSLLRQAAQRARGIGEIKVADDYATQLDEHITQYGKHYDSTVSGMLDEVRNKNPFDRETGRSQPWAAMLEVQTRSQITMGYLRDCWPNFSEKRFPGQSRPILDREVFTPLLGSYFDGKSPPPAVLPTQSRPTGPIEGLRVGGKEFVDGLSLRYMAGNGPGGVSGTTIGGTGGDWWEITNVVDRQHIVAVEASSGFALNRIRFIFGDSSTSMWSGGFSGNYPTPVRYEHSGFRVSSVQGFGLASGFGNVISGCIFGFQLLKMGAAPTLSEPVHTRVLAVWPSALDI